MFRHDHGRGSVKPPVHRSEFFSESLCSRIFHFLWARPPQLSQTEPPGHRYVFLLHHINICALCSHGKSIQVVQRVSKRKAKLWRKNSNDADSKGCGSRQALCVQRRIHWEVEICRECSSGTQLKLSCFLWVHCRAVEGGSCRLG